ncbi:MAG: ExbD/TolR family protein [Flavobacteriales bacterium]
MARKSKEVPEINAGSMADIAFLLLIFFLVTTTMDQDSGISRKLPAKPPVDDPTPPPPVKEKNIFVVLVNQSNDLLVEENPMNVEDLKEATIEFITNNDKKDNLSENPKKAVVSLRNHRLTSYDAYVAVQDQLTAAYNEVRNTIANQRFGKKFDELTKEQAKEVRKDYPMNISEAEPIKE